MHAFCHGNGTKETRRSKNEVEMHPRIFSNSVIFMLTSSPVLVALLILSKKLKRQRIFASWRRVCLAFSSENEFQLWVWPRFPSRRPRLRWNFKVQVEELWHDGVFCGSGVTSYQWLLLLGYDQCFSPFVGNMKYAFLFICLAFPSGSDQPEAGGIEQLIHHLDSSGGLLPRPMRGEMLRPAWVRFYFYQKISTS